MYVTLVVVLRSLSALLCFSAIDRFRPVAAGVERPQYTLRHKSVLGSPGVVTGVVFCDVYTCTYNTVPRCNIIIARYGT